MNRLKDLFEEPTPDESEGDYFTIDTRCESFAVTQVVAADVERVLDETPLPRWIVFVDLTGARHRMLTRTIERVSECTAAQRAAERAFRRARRQEDKADRRPWEDDD